MDNQNQDRCSNAEEVESQGLDSLNGPSDVNDDYETRGRTGEEEVGDGIAINGLEDMGGIAFNTLSVGDIMQYHFSTLEVAFNFYNWYAKLNGFCACKSKVRKNKGREKIQQHFVCYREGYREEKFGVDKTCQREPRKETRCGCRTKCIVQIDKVSGRWYVRYFNNAHNHLMIEQDFVGLLPGHRGMDDDDIMQMNDFRKAGMRTCKIYGSFASQCGGFENVQFIQKDMYNEIEKHRRSQGCDARGALAYLRKLKSGHLGLYWKHTVDNEGNMEHLFWSDERSQLDYSLFGDVLAFDATYNKNKYKCPLVIFSGVNHHNQTVVFASAIIANETEETYVWLLEKFVEVMQGKIHVSVITDGDKAIRKAIRRVFPTAAHRLCVWHLLRNATSRVKNPRFTSLFKKCMLGDYEVVEFEIKWNEIVTECGVQNNRWVQRLYARKENWATTYIRGSFFAGFRTTSRCEGFNAQVGKFVNARNNLVEFLQHFTQCLQYFRFKEVEADFASIHGEVVLQTRLQSLERSVSKVYTKGIFLFFRSVLEKVIALNIVCTKRTSTCMVFFVTKYCRDNSEWHVTYAPMSMEIKCSCLRMESLGIPCDHIVRVMVYLNMTESPQGLVLDRWTKHAKDSIRWPNKYQSSCWDSMMVCRYKSLNQRSKDLNELGCRTVEDYEDTMELLTAHYDRLKMKHITTNTDVVNQNEQCDRFLHNPVTARTKDRGARGLSVGRTGRRSVHCSVCGAVGHNKQTCTMQRHIDVVQQSAPSEDDESCDDEFDNSENSSSCEI